MVISTFSLVVLMVYLSINLFVFIEGVLTLFARRYSLYEVLLVKLMRSGKMYMFNVVYILCAAGYFSYAGILILFKRLLARSLKKHGRIVTDSKED